MVSPDMFTTLNTTHDGLLKLFLNAFVYELCVWTFIITFQHQTVITTLKCEVGSVFCMKMAVFGHKNSEKVPFEAFLQP